VFYYDIRSCMCYIFIINISWWLLFTFKLYPCLSSTLIDCELIVKSSRNLGNGEHRPTKLNYHPYFSVLNGRELNRLDNARSARATDALLNYETVKYFANEELEAANFGNAIAAYQVRESERFEGHG
jgi:hypothetical protein